MDRFMNAMRGHAAIASQAQGQPRFGTVTSYNPNDGTAKVRLQPEGTQTGWLPVLSAWVGSGWGIHAPLSTGEQVLVLPQDGDAEHGVIVGRAWSDQMRPPVTPSGELWLVHQTGASIKMTQDGQITATDAAGTSVALTNTGVLAVTAPSSVTVTAPVVSVSATLSVGNGATGTFPTGSGLTVQVQDGIITNIY